MNKNETYYQYPLNNLSTSNLVNSELSKPKKAVTFKAGLINDRNNKQYKGALITKEQVWGLDYNMSNFMHLNSILNLSWEY